MGKLCKENDENSNDTHFDTRAENGRTLVFKGDRDVKCVDVFPRGEGMTMILRLFAGKEAKIIEKIYCL